MNKDNFIYKIFLKNKSVKTDSRKIKNGDIFFALSGENFNGNEFIKSALKNGADLVVGDDELKITEQFSVDDYKKLLNEGKIIIVKNSLKTLQNLAKKYRQDLKIPFLAITGSNGKTTTKELLREVLKKKYNVLATEGNLNNHIGVPLIILSIKPEHNFAIIEMGANHIGEIKVLAEIVKPNFGIITNIGLAHVGEFGSLENIIKTKKELYDEVLKNNGKIFLNSDSKVLQKIAAQFSAEKRISYKKAKILNSENFLKIEIDNKKIKTKLVGEYNVFNIQAAFTVGNFFKVETCKIVTALENYIPENNRSQKEITEKENEVIWDCYNANPTSMKSAIESFLKNLKNKKVIFILGQMAEMGEFSEREHKKVLSQISKSAGKKLLVGTEFKKFEKEFSEKKDFKFFKDVFELENFLEKEKIQNSEIIVKGSNSTKLFILKDKGMP